MDSLVCSQEAAGIVRHLVHRRGLSRDHVPIETWRPPDGPAGIIDDEIQPIAADEELPAERFNARRVAQVEAEDLEAISPLPEIGLLGIAGGGIARKPGRDDQMCPGSQQLQAGLITDLYTPTGQKGRSTTEIGELCAL